MSTSDENPPATSRRERLAGALGCFVLLPLLAVLAVVVVLTVFSDPALAVVIAVVVAGVAIFGARRR